jgi:serine/threonine protein kinase
MEGGERSSGDARSQRESPTFHPGLVLDGRYRLDRPLAEGGMGSVWVGQQIALRREVAVKLLRTGSDSLRERLRREALALAAVHHPSVVEVFDYGETEAGSPYLVMELVRGEPLGEHVKRSGPFDAVEAARLALPLLEGLVVAHRAGIVHRDIKPENVVLSAGPAGVQPKLIDFGIARMAEGDAARLTGDGGIVGTPAYMAPEQVRGLDVDGRADVWGMAALLYEMISGKAPFGTEDVMAVIRRVLEDPPPFPRSARGLDGKMWSILMAALRKDPADRTPSVLALRDSLVGWLEARGASASVSSPRSPRQVSPGEVADTEPMALSADPESFDALIRAKFGQS